MPNPLPSSRDRLYYSNIDLIRSSLAIYLAISHIFPSVKLPDHAMARLATDVMGINFYATGIIFVVSGFLLASHMCRAGQEDHRINRKEFVVKRFLAIYPIHVFSLLLFVGIEASSNHGVGNAITERHNPWILDDAAPTLATGRTVMVNGLLNVLMLHAWNPFDLMFNVPSWSISALMFFYVVFALALPLLHRVTRPGWAMAGLTAVFLATGLAGYLSDGGPLVYGILQRNPVVILPEFAAGALLFVILERRRSTARDRLWTLAAIAVTIASPALCVALRHLRDLDEVGANVFFLCHNGLLLPGQIALVAVAVAAPQVLSARSLVQRLGRASLSIFALHIPLWALTTKASSWLVFCAHVVVYGIPMDEALSIHRRWEIPPTLALAFIAGLVLFSLVFQERLVEPTSKAVYAAVRDLRRHIRARMA